MLFRESMHHQLVPIANRRNRPISIRPRKPHARPRITFYHAIHRMPELVDLPHRNHRHARRHRTHRS
jgi:hypothetical protein